MTKECKNVNIKGIFEVGELMMKNIIKYVGMALVIVGILLVMKNLFSKEIDTFTENKTEIVYYSAKIKLLDKETGEYLEGANLILKDENDEVVAEWITEDKVYIVNKLEKGKYTLIEDSAPDNYHLNEDGIVFEIKDEDKVVSMYNVKMTEEEIREVNTTNTEVEVDNTASSKSILTVIMAAVVSTIGLSLICRVRKDY